MKFPTQLIITFITAFLFSCGSPENNYEHHLQPNNNPLTNPPSAAPHPYPDVHGGEVHGEKNFANLINNYLTAKSDPMPWAGYWWPYLQNGIAAGTFGNGISPAAKYDAARGNTTHAQDWEIRKHGMRVPNVQSWWGHCNGWCAAAALFPEPTAPAVVNGITFTVGDIKGLLSEAAMSANADFFGERLDKDDPTSPKYWDTVPDQYFLVLTNYIGKLKRTVLIDRYTGSQVWNQPLAGYRFEYPTPSDYLGNTPDAPHVYRILLTSTLWWMNDGVAPDTITHPFDFEADDPTGVVQSRTLRMELWLDGPVVFDTNGRIKSSGDVIVTRDGEYVTGGAWREGEGYLVDAWPDYMWVPYSVFKPTDPDQDYSNPQVDIDWIKEHLLVPGGANDSTVTPGQIPNTPTNMFPSPYGPSFPSGYPNGSPGSNPWGIPTFYPGGTPGGSLAGNRPPGGSTGPGTLPSGFPGSPNGLPGTLPTGGLPGNLPGFPSGSPGSLPGHGGTIPVGFPGNLPGTGGSFPSGSSGFPGLPGTGGTFPSGPSGLPGLPGIGGSLPSPSGLPSMGGPFPPGFPGTGSTPPRGSF